MRKQVILPRLRFGFVAKFIEILLSVVVMERKNGCAD